jgi:adenylate cyclase
MKEKAISRHRWLTSVQLRGTNGLGVVLFLGVLVALLLAPYVLRFETRDDPDRQATQNFWFASMLEGLEYRLYDDYFKRDESSQPALRDKVAIIKIDERSLNSIGQWPWPRALHARLIQRLKKAEARVIAFDIEFASKQAPSPDGQLSPSDQALIVASAQTKNVIFPSFLEPMTRVRSTGAQGSSQERTFLLATPFEELDETTPDLSLIVMPRDSDGSVRRYPLVGQINGSNIGGMAALACAVYQKLSMGSDQSTYETSLRRGEWFSLQAGNFPVPSRTTAYAGREAPSYREFLLKYRHINSVPWYSYSNAVNESEYDDAQMKRNFKDRIVFIGATAPILKDLFPAPGGGQVSGVELHAGAACQLLEGSYIEPPEMQTTLMNLFGMTIVSALWPQLVRPRISRIARRGQERWKARKHFRRWNFRVQDTLWFIMTGIMAILPGLCFWILCQVSFYQRGIWTVMTYPLLGSLASSGLAMVYLFTLETAERRKVMSQVGLYLDPDIMETILAYPEEEYPRPRRTVATVMFTDLQGFTSYSENHSADDVVAALNAYMSRLQPIVKKHNGSVDKYIGDAIMAYFGVPVPRDDHAGCALRCAMEIQEECCRFRADTGIPFYTRIGIHTGELIAGSIGSQSSSGSLIAYTVIGDTVNLASRLEAKNKEFGSWILCSKATADAAPGIANVEAVSASIRGKSQEVEMFIVRGPGGGSPRHDFWGSETAKERKNT